MNAILFLLLGIHIYGIVVIGGGRYVYAADQIRQLRNGKDGVLVDDKRRKPFGRITFNSADW